MNRCSRVFILNIKSIFWFIFGKEINFVIKLKDDLIRAYVCLLILTH